MPTPEGIVKSEAYETLDNLKRSGDVMSFLRVNTGKIKTEWGSWVQLSEEGHWDFKIDFIGKNNQICVAYAECKRADKPFKLDPGQIKFKNEHRYHPDIFWWEIQSGKQLERLVIANCYDRLKDIDL